MGPRGARMVDFIDFKNSFRSQLENIDRVQDYRPALFHADETLRLSDVPAEEVSALSNNLWAIISGISIGVGETKIVIGSKAVHHLFPELIPPIDGRYTVRFFYGHQPDLSGVRGETIFREIFPRFHRIAAACADQIDSLLGVGSMNTSFTKIIDNAVVGFGIERLGVKLDEE